MYDRILVPTDGSHVADSAATYGIRLADRFDATLHVIHVVEDRSPFGEDELIGERAIEGIADRATARGLDVTNMLLDTDLDVHDEIIEYATERMIDLVVMGTHGHSGFDRFLIGSVAEQTLRESPVPVAAVHEDMTIRPDVERLLVPTDGTDSSGAAVDHAIDLAVATGSHLYVVHVSDESPFDEGMQTIDVSGSTVKSVGIEAVDDAFERARESPITTIEVAIPSGRVDQEILASAAAHDVDCIVMGTHGESGLRRYLLGGTTDRVVRFATVPVIGLSAPRAPAATLEYLDYAVVDEQGWSLDDEDLFERAARIDAGADVHGTIEVARDEYVLDAAEAAGLDWSYSCRAGGCVDCVAVVVEGDVEMNVNRTLSPEEVDEKRYCLTCVATPTSETVGLIFNARYHDDFRDRIV